MFIIRKLKTTLIIINIGDPLECVNDIDLIMAAKRKRIWDVEECWNSCLVPPQIFNHHCKRKSSQSKIFSSSLKTISISLKIIVMFTILIRYTDSMCFFIL